MGIVITAPATDLPSFVFGRILNSGAIFNAAGPNPALGGASLITWQSLSVPASVTKHLMTTLPLSPPCVAGDAAADEAGAASVWGGGGWPGVSCEAA